MRFDRRCTQRAPGAERARQALQRRGGRPPPHAAAAVVDTQPIRISIARDRIGALSSWSQRSGNAQWAVLPWRCAPRRAPSWHARVVASEAAYQPSRMHLALLLLMQVLVVIVLVLVLLIRSLRQRTLTRRSYQPYPSCAFAQLSAHTASEAPIGRRHLPLSMVRALTHLVLVLLPGVLGLLPLVLCLLLRVRLRGRGTKKA